MALTTQVANSAARHGQHSGRTSPNPDNWNSGPEVPSIAIQGTSSPLEDINRSRTSTLNTDTEQGQANLPTEEQFAKLERLRRQLRFFFMNPWEKWKARRQFPWKLLFQVLKILLVTIQLFFFGATRLSRIAYNDETRIMLSHLFYKDWDATMDVYVYPPAAGPFSIHTKDKMYENLSHGVKRYYTIHETALSPLDYNYWNGTDNPTPPMQLCLESYDSFEFFARNRSYSLDTHVTTDCLWIDLDNATRIEMLNESQFIKKYLDERGFEIKPDSFIQLDLKFNLTTLHVKRTIPSDEPECYILKTNMKWDNTDQTGIVKQSLEVDPNYFKCTTHGKTQGVLYSTKAGVIKAFVIVLDVLVEIICIVSLLLCGRALVKGVLLKQKTERLLESYLQIRITTADKWDFINLWYVMIVINDCCIILGTIFKMGTEFSEKNYASGLFTATGMLLGVGDFLVWCGVLRYLGFFSHYNILIITMKKSLPNVIRFMVCAGILYFGFLFCGWLVLGPYSLKFHDIKRASECLFSLINGDDMFATFYTINDKNTAVKWFGRIYLYVFIAMFIYVVLSLFISIIMDAYEVVKERIEGDEAHGFKSPLYDFIAECVDTPRPGNFEREHLHDSLTDVCRCSAGWCWNCLKRRKERLVDRKRRHSYQSIGDNRSDSGSETEYG